MRWIHSPVFAWLILLCGISGLIWLGYYKENLLDVWAEFLAEKFSGSVSQSAASASDFMLHNRKLTATTAMSFMYLTLSSVCVWVFSGSRFWFITSVGIQLCLMGISLVVYITGLYAADAQIWWKTAQDIKMLIQSPFLLVVISGASYWFRQSSSVQEIK